jgi:predicted dehydrogenase
MGYMYRYNPAVLLLREFLAGGWLGEPFEVHAVMSKVVDPASRKEHAEFRGGMMFELGCHLIDLLVGVLGRPGEVVPFAQRVGAADDGLMDNMLAVCRYPRALATVKSSGLEVDGFARRHFVVCGSEGTFHIQPLDAPDVRVALAEARGPHPKGRREIAFGDYPRYAGDAADLARVIRGEKAFEYSYDHDLAVQETVLRASGMPLD